MNQAQVQNFKYWIFGIIRRQFFFAFYEIKWKLWLQHIDAQGYFILKVSNTLNKSDIN